MYKDWFSNRSDAQLNYYIYVRDPKHLLPDEITRQDQSAARYIQEAQQLIQGLTEYRAALAARYGEMCVMPYHRTLSLVRRVCYDNSKRYEIELTRIYDDGTKESELSEHYTGRDRRKALSRYDDLLRQYPGIAATQDIAKRPWEH